MQAGNSMAKRVPRRRVAASLVLQALAEDMIAEADKLPVNDRLAAKLLSWSRAVDLIRKSRSEAFPSVFVRAPATVEAEPIDEGTEVL